MIQKLFQKTFILVFLVFVLSSAAQLAEKNRSAAEPTDPRVLSARDTLRINRVGNPQITPDLQWILYTKTIRDMDDKDLKSTTHVWRVRADGTARRQMTYGSEDCTSPSWFPDGKKVVFLTARVGSKQPDDQPDRSSKAPRNQIYFM